jgi:hypothetical protein
MGTWAVDAFGNDTSADWAWELEKAADISLVEKALDTAISANSDYLGAPEAMEALAAAEVIARLQGNWGERSSYSDPVDKWVEANAFIPTGGLIAKAHQVLELVVGPNSELNELWQESSDHEAWLASVAELKSRVQA